MAALRRAHFVPSARDLPLPTARKSRLRGTGRPGRRSTAWRRAAPLVLPLAAAACTSFQPASDLRERAIYHPEPVPQSTWNLARSAANPAQEALRAAALPLREPAAGRNLGLVISMEGPGPEGHLAALEDVLVDRGFALLRFPVKSLLREPLAVNILGDGDLGPAAAAIARAVDTALAHSVLAVESAVTRLAQERPELKTDPLILVGSSLGTATAAAAAARTRLAPDAMVLAAPSGNLLEVTQSRPGHDFGVTVAARDGRLDARSFRWLLDVYLAESELDPLKTSRFMVRTPVLLLRGRFDEVMPTFAGDEFYLRLGRPDRLSILGGHESLLDEVADRAEWIADWIERAVFR